MTATGTCNGRDTLGSTVVGVRWVDTWPLNTLSEFQRWYPYREGDALVCDLGSQGLLLGLLEYVQSVNQDGFRSTEADLSCLLTPSQWAQRGDTHENGEMFNQLTHAPLRAVLPRQYWPILVWLKDPRDIRTLILIDPDAVSEKLGNGVRLDGFTVEVTDAPVSRGIMQRLPFIEGMLSAPDRRELEKVSLDQRPIWDDLNQTNFMIDYGVGR